jgi:alanine racemase
MPSDRRTFLRASAGAALFGSLLKATDAAAAAPARDTALRVATRPSAGYEPWIEVDDAALLANAREVARLAGGRPILAVIKNGAYGLGIARVGPVLDGAPEVSALAVVKPEEALALRAAGVRKPILLMALADVETGIELVRRGVQLAPFTDDALDRLGAIARAVGRPVPVHAYIDSGMGRMGMRIDRAAPWLETLARSPHVRLEGTFTELAESDASDDEQIARFAAFADAARSRGVAPGALHAASSHGLFFRAHARFDAVRPGLVLYGAYPAGAMRTQQAMLRPAFRLHARVVRVERIAPGDGVSYGRNYVAERPTWIATLPIGHADGYPRRAVNGGRVMIGARTYPVIGAVSASHTIVELGDDAHAAVGDVATLLGPDDPAIHPNTLAERAEISVYDVLMHLARGTS